MSNPIVSEWIYRADQDLNAAHLMLDADPFYYSEPITFHLQQSLEKLLKAILIKNGQDFYKTHSLDDLAKEVAPFIPDWKPDFTALDHLTELVIGTRYPGYDVDPDELKWGVELCQSIRQLLVDYLKEEPAP